jgi:putative acetyltransferase
MHIEPDNLSRPEVHALLHEHLSSMASLSPADSVHALDLDGLRQPDVTFWTAWSGPDLLGCGALKELSPTHGEIKSMRTATAHLRKGVGRAILAYIIDEARKRSYNRLSLETGSMQAFQPAHQLYLEFGFTFCQSFADYVEDPHCVFMTRTL